MSKPKKAPRTSKGSAKKGEYIYYENVLNDFNIALRRRGIKQQTFLPGRSASFVNNLAAGRTKGEPGERGKIEKFIKEVNDAQ